jgi:hypothetical protein
MSETDVEARLTLLNDGGSLLPLLLVISDEVSNEDVAIKPNHARPGRWQFPYPQELKRSPHLPR